MIRNIATFEDEGYLLQALIKFRKVSLDGNSYTDIEVQNLSTEELMYFDLCLRGIQANIEEVIDNRKEEDEKEDT